MTNVFTAALPAQQEQPLDYAVEALSDYMTAGLGAAGNFIAKLKGVMPSVVRGFTGAGDAAGQASEFAQQLHEYKLTSDQSKLLKITSTVPYTALREMRAYAPPGLSVTYLELATVLVPATQHLLNVRALVVEPYMQQLARLVSDTQGVVSSKDYASVYKKARKTTQEFETRLAKLYRNHEETETLVGKVIERNSDWKTVFQAVANAKANVEALDTKGMRNQIATCADYLNILHDRIVKNEVTDASREAAQGLAEGAHAVGQEMQFLATTYYRVLQWIKAVDDTAEHIKENMS